MHISELLLYQLKKDVIKDLEQKYQENDTLQKLTKEDYSKKCILKFEVLEKDIKFLIQDNKKCNYKSENRCCARIWDSHYGTRCVYKRKNNTDYCQHHLKTIQKNGSLVFNRYDEENPIFNAKGNKIPWFHKSRLEMLNDIIQRQSIALNKKINTNSRKQRQIAP